MTTSPQTTIRPPSEDTTLPPFEYQQRLALERPRAWRGIVALLLLLLGMLVFSAIFTLLGVALDAAIRGGFTPEEALSPLALAGSLLGLAALTPWSMLLQKWFFGVPMASLQSVLSRFRWDIFGRTLVIILPIMAILHAAYPWLLPIPTADYALVDVVAYVVIALTLLPLQSMGEEYAFRGLAFRIAASWGRSARTGLVLGIVVSSLLFMVAHFALDPWLNLYYFVFGVALCVITWRTGGLEAAIVLHAVNNSIAGLVSAATRADLMAGFDRSVGAASAVMLIPCALLAAVAGVIWWRTRRPARSLPHPDSALAR